MQTFRLLVALLLLASFGATKLQAQPPWLPDEKIFLDPAEIGRHLIVTLPVRGPGNEEFTVTYCGAVKDFRALEKLHFDYEDAITRPAFYVQGAQELWVFVAVYWIDRA